METVDRQNTKSLNGNAKVLHLLGGTAYQAGKIDDAVKLFQKAIHKDPTKDEFFHDLGVALHALGRYGKAADAFQLALSICPISSQGTCR